MRSGSGPAAKQNRKRAVMTKEALACCKQRQPMKQRSGNEATRPAAKQKRSGRRPSGPARQRRQKKQKEEAAGRLDTGMKQNPKRRGSQ
ncbi:hypothetical protein CYMTET_40063 [Cymbomonas tetramitiformis]|uniref:Uncharacterized protein n=1 Tax=Cymbomonas tetramitiformis TaxID=36881 RepID=A0AAE0C8W8_9CHLO|nr:hypothetical protein CYMTET_40063 [Cymbomonas tetramitiformis]